MNLIQLTRNAMARLSTEKLQLLKKAFTQDALSPGQAAQAVGITYATAKRYYDRWADEIKRSLESRLLPSLEAGDTLRLAPGDPARLIEDGADLRVGEQLIVERRAQAMILPHHASHRHFRPHLRPVEDAAEVEADPVGQPSGVRLV